MILKTTTHLFKIAGGLGLGLGLTNFMESRPYIGVGASALGVAFIAAAKAIKHYEDKQSESKFTKLTLLPSEQPATIVLTGETEQEFKDRLTEEMMASFGDGDSGVGISDVTPIIQQHLNDKLQRLEKY
ncbi:MAG: hypothetical protein A3J37_07775 [Alphaproteobacteria bacterium RIFCSPHIGHO2_12_FULL_45_9]|nr:MAG: hypothetical protein A3B66_09655 [Alphaproteobacteria bacterium RIFCSPHIGHO2_02_FULL_46_13]OFW93991.1 MAG: hypothetical protein A3J37_07775 [Alphaproteobacteria bacterium RIFCSPHIGHO2_12_FULL_45_9]